MMDDNILALCELSSDLVYGKIPQNKLCYYITNSLNAGKETAKEFQGSEIMMLYDKHHIRIKYLDRSSEKYGVMLRGSAVLSQKECSVELYRASISALAAHSKFEGGALLDYDLALKIHLAHEFYHYLEYKKGSTISMQLDPVQTMKIKFLKRSSHVRRCEEIAAHAFAKELLNLSVLPNYYDYLYLIDCGKLSKDSFDSMIERNRKLIYSDD